MVLNSEKTITAFICAAFLLCLASAGGYAVAAEPITPIPTELNLNTDKVTLGETLFHDVRLSKDGTISCASCHDLKQGGTDRKRFSNGVGGAVGGRNSPTVYNSGLNFRQFWDGRAESLEDQIDGPTHHPKEMASNWKQIIAVVKSDNGYRTQFGALYSDGITVPNIKDVIATFERSLVTPNSPFDRYLRGDAAALTSAALRGYQLFKSYGCVACHQGVNVGGNMYQVIGVMRDFMAERGTASGTNNDVGRIAVTGKKTDLHKFRVPSLRLAAITPPYFHDGSIPTLESAIDVMARYQLGRSIPTQDRGLIIEFLVSLVGTYKGEQL